MQKQFSWMKQKKQWLVGVIILIVLVGGVIGVKEWRHMEHEQYEEQVKSEEKALVRELVAHYSGVDRVTFKSVDYNQMTGSTTYYFQVNQQTNWTSYLVGGAPGDNHGERSIGYDNDWFDQHERQQPLALGDVSLQNVEISYETATKEGDE